MSTAQTLLTAIEALIEGRLTTGEAIEEYSITDPGLVRRVKYASLAELMTWRAALSREVNRANAGGSPFSHTVVEPSN